MTRFSLHVVLVAAALFVAPLSGCGRSSGFSMVGGGGSTSSDGWWFLAGSSYLKSDEPGVFFGMQKTPDGKREFSYVILFKHANTTGGNFAQARHSNITFDGTTAAMRDELTIDDKSFKLALDLEADKEAGKVKVRTITIDGKDVDPTQGTVFLVDFTSNEVNYEQIHATLPADLPDPTDDTKVVEKLAQEVTQKLKSENERARKFLEP